MSEFTTWEEMSVLEQMACQYWDMYKDAHGFRPRHVDTSGWTEQEFNDEFEYLQRTINENERQRRVDEAASIEKFEQHVTNTICMGARDRETALRWIMDASSANGDWEYLCYDLGLPYHYFRKAA